MVTVSRGCLEYLTREELQGVLGHEFSHVLNGDMRLNLRLIGIVYGILVLSIVGYFVMRSAGWIGSSSRNSDDRRGDNRAAIFFIGLALYILGYLGVLLGNIIKAAISRQREFLADASSVQFTRNPGRTGRRLEKDRRACRRLADQRSPRPRNQPHVLRRRLRRFDLQPLCHASAAGGADPAARSEF